MTRLATAHKRTRARRRREARRSQTTQMSQIISAEEAMAVWAHEVAERLRRTMQALADFVDEHRDAFARVVARQQEG